MNAIGAYVSPVVALAIGAIWYWRRYVRAPYSPLAGSGFNRNREKHRRRIREADRALGKLAKIQSPAGRFAWLRKMDPFTFEEMILTALKREGASITRNRRYTGDGPSRGLQANRCQAAGIDGRAMINGEPYLIQAKRYRGHIKADHVREFGDLCMSENAKGLFVHSERTSGGSVAAIHSRPVRIVCGNQLLGLFDAEQRLIPKLVTTPGSSQQTEGVFE